MRPVPQPSVRPLDDGRLLQLRRLLQPDRPQGGRRLSRDDRLQSRRRRGEPSRRRPRDGAEVPGRAEGRLQRQGPPRGAGRLAHLAREPLLRHQRGQSHLGPLLRRRHRRAGRRRPRQQSAGQPRAFPALGRKLVEYKYDFKRLVRDICLSQTYQRATQTNASNEGDERNFAHARVRRIQAEMLLDCISR